MSIARSVATLFCLEKDESTRHALESILKTAGYDVVSFAREGDLLLELRAQIPLAILADCANPTAADSGLLKQLCARYNSVPVIVLSSDARISAAVSTIKGGAADFLAKPVRRDDLLNSLKEIVGSRHSDFGAEAPSFSLREFPGSELLTRRQLQVLQDLVSGASAKASAAHLGISFRTVESHRQTIKRELGVTTTAEIVRRVYRRAAWNGNRLRHSYVLIRSSRQSRVTGIDHDRFGALGFRANSDRGQFDLNS